MSITKEKPVIPIVLHLQEVSNFEILGRKIQGIVQKYGKSSQFLITVLEREPRAIVTGFQDHSEEI
jgi:hypothetical protein